MNKKEYILCAAIWYGELPLARTDIPIGHYLPINCGYGIVMAGKNHMQCLYQMTVLTGTRQAEVGRHVQGFLTNRNRFVDRIEGAEIAYLAGQIKNKKRKLFSEDLY